MIAVRKTPAVCPICRLCAIGRSANPLARKPVEDVVVQSEFSIFAGDLCGDAESLGQGAFFSQH